MRIASLLVFVIGKTPELPGIEWKAVGTTIGTLVHFFVIFESGEIEELLFLDQAADHSPHTLAAVRRFVGSEAR